MTKKTFVSHASKNAWLTHDLIALINAASPDMQVFCTSEAVIQPGENYKKAIFTGLEQADLFVAIISNEYWKSKYCIMELGAAYQRYYFEGGSLEYILPLLMPPLDKGMALANTPLVEMQLTDLTDPAALMLFLKRIAGPDRAREVDRLEVQVAEYVAMLQRHILSTTSLVENASADVFYDELQPAPCPRNQIVRCERLDGDRFSWDFRLSRLDYTPSFASLALMYWDDVNLKKYLAYDAGATFCFTVNNAGGVLQSIDIEFKYGSVHQVFKTYNCELEEGENEVALPLEEMRHMPLDRINQICFVIHPEAMNGLDGILEFGDIAVRFESKNLLQ